MVWLGAPDQGVMQGPVRPVGLERERDQPNILPLDLIIILLTLYFEITLFKVLVPSQICM